MIKNYFKTAWRSLVHQKGSSALNIGGLAVAMAASILILLWVQNELRYDNYNNDAARIYLLTQYDTARAEYAFETTPFPAYTAIGDAVPEVELMAMAQPASFSGLIFEVNGKRFQEKNALLVDSNWTRMFSYKVLKGSLDLFANNRDAIIISRSKAKKYFGNLPPLEQTVYIDSLPYSIAAVVEDIPANASLQQDILLPNAIFLGNESRRRSYESWGFYSQLLFTKLAPHTTPSRTEEKITEIFRNNQPWNKSPTRKSRLIPLLDLHFKQELNSSIVHHGNPQNVRIFTLLAVLLLTTASINFVNLSIARIGLRTKEIGVRKIVGAGKAQLFSQVMVETTLFAGLALAIALLVAALALPYFNAFTENQFVLRLWDAPLMLLLSGVFLFVLLLTGCYPALLLAALKPMGLLKNRGLAGMSRQGLRKVLVTGQLALAVVMLIGIITIYRQFVFIQQQVAGYQKEQVFKIHALLPSEPIYAYDVEATNRHTNTLNNIKTDLLASSAIQSVSRVNGVSMIDDTNAGASDMVWTGYPEMPEKPDIVQLWVDEDYAQTANLTLKSGRWFDPTNVSDKHNVILNETAVKTFGLQEPVVGAAFSGGINGAGGAVVGVVKDFHHKSLREQIDPVVISIDPFMGHMYLVKAHAGNVAKALEHARAIWAVYHPGHPFEYVFLDEEFDRLYKDDRKALSFSIVFGSLSILIACLGLLGMVMASAQQRTKEIGIRKVLGASVSGIVSLLSKDFVKLALIAIAIASPIAWWAMNTWLEGFAYRITIQWWVFAIAGTATVAIALATVGWQAIRAAAANPVDSLRDE